MLVAAIVAQLAVAQRQCGAVVVEQLHGLLAARRLAAPQLPHQRQLKRDRLTINDVALLEP